MYLSKLTLNEWPVGAVDNMQFKNLGLQSSMTLAPDPKTRRTIKSHNYVLK